MEEVTTMIAEVALQAKVGELLTTLYAKRFAALDRLTLTKLLGKNPYLYRALGVGKPSDLIDQLLAARISSSDETIFGNDFFEPLAIFAAQHATGTEQRSVVVGAGAGQDIAIETATQYLAISVKSGTNIFNSQSAKGQSAEFNQLQARLKKLGKMFRPIIGYGYGRKAVPKKATPVEKVAGQTFWTLLSGEEDFHLRISDAMTSFAQTHRAAFHEAFEVRNCKLLKEFMLNFVSDAGVVDWDAVVNFNSSATRPKRLKKAIVPKN
jgi:hypothetical protein